MSILPIEIQWLARVVGDRDTRRLMGRASLGFAELVSEAEEQIAADLDPGANLPPALRNHPPSASYGFDALGLPERLRVLPHAERVAVLDAVEAAAVPVPSVEDCRQELAEIAARRAAAEQARAEAMADLAGAITRAKDAGMGIRDIARTSGVSRNTVYALLERDERAQVEG